MMFKESNSSSVRVMKPGNHLSNGVSPKVQMSRGNLIGISKRLFFMFLFASAIICNVNINAQNVNRQDEVVQEEVDEYYGYLKQNGLNVVEANGKPTLVDSNNKTVLLPKWEQLYCDKDGILAIADADGKCGYYTAQGKKISDIIFDSELVFAPLEWGFIDHFFKDGFAVVRKNNLCGILSIKGDILVDCSFYLIEICSDGMFLVTTETYKYGFYNSKRLMLVPTWYDEAGCFDDGYAPLKRDGRDSYIDIVGYEWATIEKAQESTRK